MKTRKTLRLGYVLLIGAVLVYFIRALSLSLFFAPPERLNVVFYSDQTYLYSLGIENGIHYVLPFPSNMKIQIPGGYGEYRVGALGKLIGFEKDPTLLKRAFTYNSSSFVPYYFYPTQSSIYYSPGEEGIHIPTLKDILTSQSNASFLDKLFIYSKFGAVSRNDFIAIDTTKYSDREGEDHIFSSQDFKKKFIGYFYNKTYRTERKTVQIIYSKDYNTAVGIGQILEGNGIRVVDYCTHARRLRTTMGARSISVILRDFLRRLLP